jgi:hypothetical protein
MELQNSKIQNQNSKVETLLCSSLLRLTLWRPFDHQPCRASHNAKTNVSGLDCAQSSRCSKLTLCSGLDCVPPASLFNLHVEHFSDSILPLGGKKFHLHHSRHANHQAQPLIDFPHFVSMDYITGACHLPGTILGESA